MTEESIWAIFRLSDFSPERGERGRLWPRDAPPKKTKTPRDSSDSGEISTMLGNVFRSLLLVSVIACTGCQTGGRLNCDALAKQGYKSFGGKIEADRYVRLASAIDRLGDSAEQAVCVKAKIAAVCRKRGCWMTLTDGGKEVRVRFTTSPTCAEGFFVPRNAQGHEAYVWGTIKRDTMSEELAKHYAEDAGASEKEIARIRGPQPTVTMVARGVMISDADRLEPPPT